MRWRAAFAAACLLQACATKTDPLRIELQVPPQWLTEAGTLPIERNWWTGFGDPVLTRLVEEGLERNLDLHEAAARLAEARAQADAQRGSALPSLDAGGGAGRSRSISAVFLEPYLSTTHSAQFQAAYEVDLWARLAALTSAADANSQALRAARDTVTLSVAASVATSYINLRAIDAELEVARRTLASRERSLALTLARQRRGYGDALETAQAESELRATAQVIPQLELAAEQQERVLNVLLARPPVPIERGTSLLSLNAYALPAAGLPSELLRRRPDIASAEFQLAAADAQLAAARAQLLPSVRLSASFGSVGSSVFRNGPFTVWSLGGSVLAPIFNGGSLRALAEASASRRDQALIGYQRTVLTSFAEVETQLTAYAKQQDRLAQTEAQRVAVAEALRIARRRHAQGYSSYLDELLAERDLFNAEERVLQIRAQLLMTGVAVYRALGGGWQARSPSSACSPAPADSAMYWCTPL